MAKTLPMIMAALLFIGAILPASSEEEIDFSSSAKEINYGSLEGDNAYGPAKNPTNPYNLGCTSGEKCRGSRRLLSDVEDAVEGAKEGAENVKDKVVNLFR